MTRKRNTISLLLTLAALVANTGRTTLAAGTDPLLSGFQSPPASARPHIWWHWMNGNVTREGITRDLEAMKRVGIAGVQIFTADLETPVDVPKPLVYMSPEWLDTLRFAASECERLGLEMAIHSAAGWSETGGTWVKPADAMQKLVWSETKVQGPRRMDDPLPTPPSVFGPFQTLSQFRLGKNPPKPGVERFYYRDAAVLAFPTPTDDQAIDEKPTLSSSIPGFDPVKVSDGDGNTRQTMTFPTVTGPWQVSWQGLAAPKPMSLQTLVNWPNHPDASVRHFAGSATYETTVEVPRGKRVTVDLGEVHNFAEVSLDGKRVGPVLWKPPFRVDLGPATPGKHSLSVRVTNMWPNRMIGDLNLPEAERVTWTTHNTYKKDSPLQPSGLVGPVQLRVSAR